MTTIPAQHLLVAIELAQTVSELEAATVALERVMVELWATTRPDGPDGRAPAIRRLAHLTKIPVHEVDSLMAGRLSFGQAWTHRRMSSTAWALHSLRLKFALDCMAHPPDDPIETPGPDHPAFHEHPAGPDMAEGPGQR